MLKLNLYGLSDGLTEQSIESDSNQLKDLFAGFSGLVSVTGNLRKIGDTYTFSGHATCMTELICDLSLKRFTTEINTEVSITIYSSDSEQKIDLDKDIIYIPFESKTVDISPIIYEQLLVSIPIKKIAPEFIGKEIDEIYPNLKENGTEKANSTWDSLKKIDFN